LGWQLPWPLALTPTDTPPPTHTPICCCSNPDEKMSEKGHYIDLPESKASIGPALEDEMAADNKKRPGRYLMLQRLEAAPKADKHLAAKFNVASMKSSLTTARYLKEQVGDMSWNEYVSTLGSQ